MIIIDRFEEEFAVCEKDGKGFEKIPRSLICKTASEGDVIVLSDGIYVTDHAETAKRKKDVNDKFYGLFNWQNPISII